LRVHARQQDDFNTVRHRSCCNRWVFGLLACSLCVRAVRSCTPALSPPPNQQARGILSFASIILLFASPLLLRWLEYRKDKMLLLLHSHHHDRQSAPFPAKAYAEHLPTLEQVAQTHAPIFNSRARRPSALAVHPAARRCGISSSAPPPKSSCSEGAGGGARHGI
jgi:hypothetical protein